MSPNDHPSDALEALFEALDDLVDLEVPMPARPWVAGLHMSGVPDRGAPERPSLPPAFAVSRVSSDPLCGYDVNGHGERARLPPAERRPPCRRVATHVVTDWEDDFADLYLCPRHVRALINDNPDDEIEPELLTRDLDCHVESQTSPSKTSQPKKFARRACASQISPVLESRRPR